MSSQEFIFPPYYLFRQIEGVLEVLRKSMESVTVVETVSKVYLLSLNTDATNCFERVQAICI